MSLCGPGLGAGGGSIKGARAAHSGPREDEICVRPVLRDTDADNGDVFEGPNVLFLLRPGSHFDDTADETTALMEAD